MKKLMLALLATPLIGCVAMPIGADRSEIADKLRFTLLEYGHEGKHVVWTYEWVQHSIGATASPRSRSVVYMEDGKVVEVENLGRDRDDWVAKLRVHGVDWDEWVFDAIRDGKVEVGMSQDQMLMAWGHPKSPQNNRLYLNEVPEQQRVQFAQRRGKPSRKARVSEEFVIEAGTESVTAW